MSNLKVPAHMRSGSFDVVPSARSIPSNNSEDSDMAQYSRRHKAQRSDTNTKDLEFAGFGAISQCLNTGVITSGHALTEMMKLTKTMLYPQWNPGNIGLSHAQHGTEITDGENVEIGEEEILRRDYDFERV